MPPTIAQALVAYAECLGIARFYGMPGAHILPVFDALHCRGLSTILAKHEQGAGFMALGDARAGGRPAACVTTAGPGATNLVTPLASAYADHLPVLAICGETSTTIFGRGGLQEASGEGGAIDLVALLKPITRYVRRIERADYLPQVLQQASQALFGREPGPVALVVPFNVQREAAPVDLFRRFQLPSPPQAGMPDANILARLAAALTACRRPMILAGGGCLAPATAEKLPLLAERLSAPVATTLKAKGVLDERAPYALGCLGVTSDGAAKAYLAEADALLVLGASFSERTSYLWDESLFAGKRLFQIDRDASRIGRNFPPEIALVAELATSLDSLLEQLPPHSPALSPLRPAPAIPPHFATIARFFSFLRDRLPKLQLFDDNIILAQTYFDASPSHRYYPNTGISALGHAIPAALGAKACNGWPTLAIVGDGGFQMCGFELMTAISHRLPLSVLVIRNDALGLIRKNQFQHYGGRLIACDFVNPDYRRLAEAFGFNHFRLDSTDDVDILIARADFSAGYNLIELPWDKDVFPSYRVER